MNLRDQYIELLIKSLNNETYVELEATIAHLCSRVLNNLPISLEDLYGSRYRNPSAFDVVASAKEIGDTVMFDGTEIRLSGKGGRSQRAVCDVSHTMIGRKRLDNLRACCAEVVTKGIPGDFIETGVWRGGATILMRGILHAYDIRDRVVWVADSFDGLPEPSLAEDQGYDLSKKKRPSLAVSIDDVRDLFSRYDLLDKQVCFLKGWFKDTLHTDKISKIAVLRLDGDLYESTMDALTALYEKVSKNGFVIVDDYRALPPCERAITDFRRDKKINDPIMEIDGTAIYWKKSI